MNKPEFMVLIGKGLDTLTAAQAAAALAPELEALGYVVKKPDEASTGPIKEPPVEVKPKQAAGYPRTQVGTRIDKGVLHGIYTGTGMPGLLEVVSGAGEPDAYVDRGYNFPYDSLPGVPRPTGPETFWGLDPVPGAIRQVGYRQRYFPADGRAYWEQSELADEAKPVVPAATANDDVTPEITGHYESSRS